MIETPAYNVCAELVRDGRLLEVDSDNVDEFLAGATLRLLFFSGPNAVRREAHDVAVALRELLQQYDGQVAAGHVAEAAGSDLQKRFRVTATPSLVFVIGGEVLEVMPRVRDWVDYAAAFGRYLGAARGAADLMENT